MVVDQFYDDESCEQIWQELCFINNDPAKFKPPAQTGSAYDLMDNGEKVYLKQNRAVSLDTTYLDRNMSSILTKNRKTFSAELADELTKYHLLFRYLKHGNRDGTLVSYYENEDYYLPHTDDATMTAVTWFYKKPKAFTGGEIVFENELKIDCVYNRTVFFPSILKHSVLPISMDKNLVGKNYGRYTITQLLSFVI